jgi:hypothetical protein
MISLALEICKTANNVPQERRKLGGNEGKFLRDFENVSGER